MILSAANSVQCLACLAQECDRSCPNGTRRAKAKVIVNHTIAQLGAHMMHMLHIEHDEIEVAYGTWPFAIEREQQLQADFL